MDVKQNDDADDAEDDDDTLLFNKFSRQFSWNIFFIVIIDPLEFMLSICALYISEM